MADDPKPTRWPRRGADGDGEAIPLFSHGSLGQVVGCLAVATEAAGMPRMDERTEQAVNPLYLGIGLYTIPEAARLMRVPLQRVSRWVRGYVVPTRQGRKEMPPVFQTDLAYLRDYPVLTFGDLLELRVVHQLREVGVTLPVIRRVQSRLATRYGTNHPFAHCKIATDGKRIYEVLEQGSDGRTYIELPQLQLAISTVVEEFFRNIEFEDSLPRRYWALGFDRRVVLDPERAFGKPVEDESGVPTYVLFGMYQAGETVQRIADWYEVHPQGVQDAIEFEERLAA